MRKMEDYLLLMIFSTINLSYFSFSTMERIHKKQITFRFSHLVPVLKPIKTREKNSQIFFIIVTQSQLLICQF